jgi:hypothetical protein
MKHLTWHSKQDDGLLRLKLALIKFTSGAPHPLSSRHLVELPAIAAFDFSDVGAELLGDHILTSVRCRRGLASFYLVSWKTGTVTLVSGVVNLNSCPLLNPRSEASRSHRNVDTSLGRSAEARGHQRQVDRADKR